MGDQLKKVELSEADYTKRNCFTINYYFLISKGQRNKKTQRRLKCVDRAKLCDLAKVKTNLRYTYGCYCIKSLAYERFCSWKICFIFSRE